MKTMKLKCVLTDEELEMRRESLLNKLDEIDLLTEDKKESAKEFGDKIKSCKAEAERARVSLRQGYEMREVEIQEKRDDKTKHVIVLRIDNGDEVTRRPMRADELQAKLFAVGGGKEEKGKGKKGKEKEGDRVKIEKEKEKEKGKGKGRKPRPGRKGKVQPVDAWDTAEAAATAEDQESE